MSESRSSAASTSNRPIWRLVIPLVILLVEVGGITSFVELPDRPITIVANARLFSGIVVSLVVLIWLSAVRISRPGNRLRRRRPVESLFWACLHLVLLQSFIVLTLRLGDTASAATWSRSLPVAWAILACGVAVTAYLPFLPISSLVSWVRQSTPVVLLAIVPGIAMVVLTPQARRLWTLVHGPATAATRTLLDLYPGDSLGGIRGDGLPTVGTQRLLLLVTPQCSEMESILAFWLIAVTLLIARWHSLMKFRYLAAIIAGTALLYCLNAGRLYLLVLMGLRFSANVCVSVAHSRIGGILFLGISIGWLMAACRLSTRREPAQ